MPCYHCGGCWRWCNGVGDVFWHTLGPLVPIGHRLNATAYLSIVSDHVHSIMAASDGYFQQDNALCHKAGIISNWFLEHDNEFTGLKKKSPDLIPIEHLWDVVERELRALDCNCNCKMLSYQYGPTFLKNSFSTLLNQCHVELRHF